jgi:hypothetical protein
MKRERAGAAGLFALVFLPCAWVFGCSSTTSVEVVAEDSGAPPELFFDIMNAQPGQVSISNSERTEGLFLGRHRTALIQVPPGSRIVIMPASAPAPKARGPTIEWETVATEPATNPASQPQSRPAE